jgi:hypothetical protein
MQSLAKIRSPADGEEIRDAVNKSVLTTQEGRGGSVDVRERAREEHE